MKVGGFKYPCYILYHIGGLFPRTHLPVPQPFEPSEYRVIGLWGYGASGFLFRVVTTDTVT